MAEPAAGDDEAGPLDLAGRAGGTSETLPDGFTLRSPSGVEELRACVRLQEEVWGEGFGERVPVAILNAALRLGGVVGGAYGPDGSLQGFVFGLTGPERGGAGLAHWSDMLAVRPSSRGRGLGRALKSFQREMLLEAGVRRVYWTFDPLRSRNAWLNLARLGAVAREHHRDLYGQTGSPLHGALGTDRLVALWILDSPRVVRRMEGAETPPGPEVLEGVPLTLEVEPGPPPRPGSVALPDTSGPWALPIPRELDPLLREAPAVARRWREATREVLEAALAKGMEVREIVPGRTVSTYLLAPSGEEG